MKIFLVKLFFLSLLQHQCLCVESDADNSNKVKRDTSIYSYNGQRQHYYYRDPSFQPPHCRNPPTCLNPNSIPTLNPEQIAWLVSIPKPFYVTMGTCWGYTMEANILLGRPVFSFRELEEMCLNQIYLPLNGLLITHGYGAQIIQTCQFNENNAAQCNNTGGDPTIDKSLQAGEMDYPIGTDGKTWVLFYRCVDNQHADFQLFTSRPYIEKKVAKKVFEQVHKLGFQASDILLLPCYYPTYSVPLQNYPIPDLLLYNFGTCPSNPLNPRY